MPEQWTDYERERARQDAQDLMNLGAGWGQKLYPHQAKGPLSDFEPTTEDIQTTWSQGVGDTQFKESPDFRQSSFGMDTGNLGRALDKAQGKEIQPANVPQPAWGSWEKLDEQGKMAHMFQVVEKAMEEDEDLKNEVNYDFDQALIKRIPFAGSAAELAEQLDLGERAERITQGKGTPRDYLEIAKVMHNADYWENEADWKEETVSDVSSIATFGAEFYLTAGTGTLTRAVGKKLGTEVAKKLGLNALLKKYAGASVKKLLSPTTLRRTAVMGPTMAGSIYHGGRGNIGQMEPTQDGGFQFAEEEDSAVVDALEASAMAYAEIAIEELLPHGFVDKLTGGMKSKLTRGIGKLFSREASERTGKGMMSRAGLGSLAEELTEERMVEIANTAITRDPEELGVLAGDMDAFLREARAMATIQSPRMISALIPGKSRQRAAERIQRDIPTEPPVTEQEQAAPLEQQEVIPEAAPLPQQEQETDLPSGVIGPDGKIHKKGSKLYDDFIAAWKFLAHEQGPAVKPQQEAVDAVDAPSGVIGPDGKVYKKGTKLYDDFIAERKFLAQQQAPPVEQAEEVPEVTIEQQIDNLAQENRSSRRDFENVVFPDGTTLQDKFQSKAEREEFLEQHRAYRARLDANAQAERDRQSAAAAPVAPVTEEAPPVEEQPEPPVAPTEAVEAIEQPPVAPVPEQAQEAPPVSPEAQAIRDAEQLLEERELRLENTENPTSQQVGHVTRARNKLKKLQEAQEAAALKDDQMEVEGFETQEEFDAAQEKWEAEQAAEGAEAPPMEAAANAQAIRDTEIELEKLESQLPLNRLAEDRVKIKDAIAEAREKLNKLKYPLPRSAPIEAPPVIEQQAPVEEEAAPVVDGSTYYAEEIIRAESTVREQEKILSQIENPTKEDRGPLLLARNKLEGLKESKAAIEAPPVEEAEFGDDPVAEENAVAVSQIDRVDVMRVFPGRKVTEDADGNFDVQLVGGRWRVLVVDAIESTKGQLTAVYNAYVGSPATREWSKDKSGKWQTFEEVYPTVESYIESDPALKGKARPSTRAELEADATWDVLGTIEVARGSGTAQQIDTLAHEAVHAAHLSGLWTDKEWAVLVEEYSKPGRTTAQQSEDIAKASQGKGIDKRQTAWEKPDFMERMVDWMNRMLSKIGLAKLSPRAAQNMFFRSAFFNRQADTSGVIGQIRADQAAARDEASEPGTMAMAEGEVRPELVSAFNEDIEVEGRDPYEVANKAGINILSQQEFVIGHVEDGDYVSALFENANEESYGFDIAVHPDSQKQGLGSELLDIAIENYEELIAGPFPDAVFEVDAVNKHMVRMLEAKGFETVEKVGGHTIMRRVDKPEAPMAMAEGESLEDTLKKKYPSLNKLIINETDTAIELQSIEVSSDSQQQGIGSDVVRQMQDYATKVGKPIILTQESSKGKKTALSKFYNKHGFKKPGSKKDFALPRHTDIWEPTTDTPMAMAESDIDPDAFNESIVMDNTGKPLILYHGGTEGGKVSDFPDNPTGFLYFFTPQKSYADIYADKYGGTVTPYHLSIKNPRFIEGRDARASDLYKDIETSAEKPYDGTISFWNVSDMPGDSASEYHVDSQGRVWFEVAVASKDQIRPVSQEPTTDDPTTFAMAEPAEGEDAEPQLPRDLRFAKPRYRDFQLDFTNDLDKALYIIAATGKLSKRDADYLAFAQEAFPDKTEAELRAMGREVRDSIKDLARKESSDVIKVPSVAKPSGKPKAKPKPKAKADPKKGDPKDLDWRGDAKKGPLDRIRRAVPTTGSRRSAYLDADRTADEKVITNKERELELRRRRSGTAAEVQRIDDEMIEKFLDPEYQPTIFDFDHIRKIIDDLQINDDPKKYELAIQLGIQYRDKKGDAARITASGRDPESGLKKVLTKLKEAIFMYDKKVLARIAKRKKKDPVKRAAGERALKKEHKRIAAIRKYMEKLGYEWTDKGFRELTRNRRDMMRVIFKAVRSKKSRPTQLLSIVSEAVYMNLLSGFDTLFRNGMSNIWWGGAMEMEELLASLVNQTFKNNKDIIFSDYLNARRMKGDEPTERDVINVFKTAFSNAWVRWTQEYGPLEEMIGVDERQKFEMAPAIPGEAGRAMRMALGLGPMAATDQFAKTMFSHFDIGRIAQHMARVEALEYAKEHPGEPTITQDEIDARALELISNTESKAWVAAMESALHKTFQDDGGPLSKAIIDSALKVKQWPGGGGFVMEQLLFLFVRTPVRFVGNISARTPFLGTLTTSLPKMIQNRLEGRPVFLNVNRELVSQLGVLLVFTLLMLDDEDPEEGYFGSTGARGSLGKDSRKFHYQAIPTQGQRLGKTWYKYDKSDPPAVEYAMLNDIVTSIKGGRGWKGTIADAGKSLLLSLQDKTFLRAMGDISKGIESEDKGQRFYESSMTRIVPGLVSQTLRHLQDDITTVEADTTTEGILRRMAIKQGPKIYTSWGEPAKRNRPWFTPAWQPAEQVRGDRVFIEWNKKNVGNEKFPSQFDKTYKVDGNPRKFELPDFAEFQRTAGTLAHKLVMEFVSESHAQKPDLMTVAVTKYLEEQARTEVKNYWKENGDWDVDQERMIRTIQKRLRNSSMLDRDSYRPSKKPKKTGDPNQVLEDEIKRWEELGAGLSRYKDWYKNR